MARPEPSLTVVLFGNTSVIQLGAENMLLGEDPPILHNTDICKIVPISRMVSGHSVSVINMLGFQESDLSLHTLDQLTSELVHENEIHAFVFVVQMCRLTDADKLGLEWLKTRFGESVLPFVMILFTYERDEDCDTIIDDLKNNTVVEKLINDCGGRYHTCYKGMDKQSEMKTLLQELDDLVSNNKHQCYNVKMYNTALKLRDVQDEPSAQLEDEKMKVTPLSQEQGEKATPVKNSTQHGFLSTLSTRILIKKRRPTVEKTNFTRAEPCRSHPAQQPEIPTDLTEGPKYTENKNLEMKKKEQLFLRLHLMEKQKAKMNPSDVLQLTSVSLQMQESCAGKDLVQMFLQRLLMMDSKARYLTTKELDSESDQTHAVADNGGGSLNDFLSKKPVGLEIEGHKNPFHPMDVQMAVFHCSDHFLKQLVATKLSQCQYALPLLVPDPFTGEIHFPLWTFRQISKSWKVTDTSGKTVTNTQSMCDAETPMVAFFRFGSVSSSKSQLLNSLINEKHATFFHRHCPGGNSSQLLMDGVVEIAWYCPSGKKSDNFLDCVAFCNLHGDAECNKEQLELLTEMSSVNVVLLSDSEEKRNNEIMQKLFEGTKPLICLCSEDESQVHSNKNGKYRIGLKDRCWSDVSRNLRTSITECISRSHSNFNLLHLSENRMISTDEDDAGCKRGKEAALKMMSQLEGKEISKLKEKHLPCQGKLWHDWCQMNKDLHRPQGNISEIQKNKKQEEMKKVREQQNKFGVSLFMKQFISTLNSSTGNDKLYFLKWVAILLDKRTSGDLHDLHYTYNEKWTKVLDRKKKHDKSGKMNSEQRELEELSRKLNGANFGLEHILREMGQIYEAFMSVQKQKGSSECVTSLPKLAAELLISGFPLELMDGDAAHVPLIWVSAVLDELSQKLGDQRIFVLSVLGTQSSGKSTMLNAMFGLQFAVSAGRCTRGAFMQLVSMSEEMKEELKFDYILIVDTEGLRALDLPGKSTRHHDNELATFVVGLGTMTLINIIGESPAEMQDILQIVVQAFLRMKEVRLNPSCMFIHQNVGDITAEEKVMNERKRLQETLDEMTKLAADEEEREVECFNDVIAFSVQEDVQYFAQLWEGSPPMAPINPSYSENILKLKNSILRKASMSHCLTLSQLKTRICDLWKALLNESFVFSFTNTLEIAVYRKLEIEFRKWTWSLRSAMLDIEDRVHNRIENRKVTKIEEKDLHADMRETKQEVEQSMKSYFEESRDKDILIQWKVRCETKIQQLLEDLINEANRNLNEVIQQQNRRETFQNKRTECDENLFSLSKELALNLKHKGAPEPVLEQEFNQVWHKWIAELTLNIPSVKDLTFWEDAVWILSEGNEMATVTKQKSLEDYKHLDRLGNYTRYILKIKNAELLAESQHTSDVNRGQAKGPKKQKSFVNIFDPLKLHLRHDKKLAEEDASYFEHHASTRALIINIIQETEEMCKKICNKIAKLGYRDTYIQEISDFVKMSVEQHQKENQHIKLRKEFTVDLCLHVCDLVHPKFSEFHQRFRDANDPRVYLEKQKPQYYSVFVNYHRGASATAVFGDLISTNLKSSILQAAYNKSAIDLAAQIKSDMVEFNGNRSQLEKHVLKSLAEEENFEKYITYIHNPKKHFRQFITENVGRYISENNSRVLTLFKGNIKDKEQRVMNTLNITTAEVQKTGGGADTWLKSFSSSLEEELSLKEITCVEQKEITDLDFLKQVVCDGLRKLMSDHDKSFTRVTDVTMENLKRKPDTIVIDHLCQCCWVQCPFCKAICTNTMEDHDGDHSAPFHRLNGINGWHFTGTTNLCTYFCTTAVQSVQKFEPSAEKDDFFPYKKYRTAGEIYAEWSITPDNSELPYWKWFVCRFQKDLEKHYKKKFHGYGEIPSNWREFTKEQALDSLDSYF